MRATILLLFAAVATFAVVPSRAAVEVGEAAWDDARADVAPAPVPCAEGEPPRPLLASAPRRAPTPSEAASAADAPTEPPSPAPRTLPLRVAILDAETGAPVHGARWGPASDLEDGPKESDVVPVPRRVGAGEALATTCARPGCATSLRLAVVTADAGLGVRHVDEEPAYHRCVSRYATSLAAVVPMRREAVVWLRVLEADGVTPASGVSAEVASGGRSLLVGGHGVAAGGRPLTVLGVPFQRGEPWQVTATGATGSTVVSGRFGKDAGLAVAVDVRLPPERAVRGRGSRRSFRCGSGCSGRLVVEDEEAPRGDVAVHAVRRDGRPAAGARVRLAFAGDGTDGLGVPDAVELSLDDAGRATARDLVAGPWTATVLEVGIVPTTRRVVVVARERVAVEVAEADGGAVDVLVVDGDGDPLPFATVEVSQPSGVPWADLEDGVQRLDACVDARGRRVLRALEAGAVELTVRFGSRSERVAAAVEDGATARVQVTLP